MKIRRRRDGGLSISIPRDELEGMLMGGALMNGNSTARVMEITKHIQHELAQFLYQPAPKTGGSVFNPPPRRKS